MVTSLMGVLRAQFLLFIPVISATANGAAIGSVFSNSSFPDHNVTTIAPNGTFVGRACLSASALWSQASQSYFRARANSTTEIMSISYGLTQRGPTYTYCDGVPRANGTSVSNVPYSITLPPDQWLTNVNVQRNTIEVSYPVPRPSCSVDPINCQSAHDSYESDFTGYSPGCTNTLSRAFTTFNESDPNIPCSLFATGVHLIYWPSTLVQSTAYSCADGTILKETVVPSGTELVTAVMNHTTYTSPTLYISFDSVWRAIGDWATFERTSLKRNVLISMNSNALYSGQGHMEGLSYSFDFLDLTGPVPLAAYQNQPTCNYAMYNRVCHTVYDDYYPNIYGPEEMKTLDPVFASCSVWPFAMHDPPIALQRQDNMINPETITPASQPTGELASPSPTARLSQVSKTIDPGGVGVLISASPPSNIGSITGSGVSQHLALDRSSSVGGGILQYPSSEKENNQQPASDAGGQGSGIGNPGIPQDPSESISRGSDPSVSEPSNPAASSMWRLSSDGSMQNFHNSVVKQGDDGRNTESETVSPGSRVGQQIPAQTSALPPDSEGQRGEQPNQSSEIHQDNPSNQITAQVAAAVSGKDHLSVGSESILSSNLSPDGSVQLLIGTQTLSAGGPAMTYRKALLSMNANSLVVEINGQEPYTIPMPPPREVATGAVFSSGSQTFTAMRSGNRIFVDRFILSLGGPVVTISGVIISAGPSGIVAGGNAKSFTALEQDWTNNSPDAIQKANTRIITAMLSDDKIIIGGSAFVAGEAAKTLDNLVIGSENIVEDLLSGSKFAAQAHPGPQTKITFTMGDRVYTISPGSVISIAASISIGNGVAVNIPGKSLSVGPDGMLAGLKAGPSAFYDSAVPSVGNKVTSTGINGLFSDEQRLSGLAGIIMSAFHYGDRNTGTTPSLDTTTKTSTPDGLSGETMRNPPSTNTESPPTSLVNTWGIKSSQSDKMYDARRAWTLYIVLLLTYLVVYYPCMIALQDGM